MFAILGNRRLTLPVLTTTICLVQQTLNARPLTPVSDDPEDLGALKPNHFLLGGPVLAEPLMPDAVIYVYKVAQAYKSDDLEQMGARVSSKVERPIEMGC